MNLILKKIIGFSKDDKKIIESTIDALKFCQTAIEFRIEKIDTARDELEFFGYDYRYGICYNIDNYVSGTSYISDEVESYYEEFLSLRNYIFKKYSDYSGNLAYPIKSDILGQNPEECYYYTEHYNIDQALKRLKLVNESITRLEKLL